MALTPTEALVSLLVMVLAPFGVGILLGIDRKVTARMQNRVGPPIVQPFYDLVKLLAKRPMVVNGEQTMFALACLFLQGAAFALLVSGGDLIVIFFVSGAGAVALELGAFSARSPYSFFGSQRELLQILAYEPVLLLVILLIGFDQGTFRVSELRTSLLPSMGLEMLALVVIMVIKLQKSPYDVATAHQEIVSGPYVEYSGPYLAILKLAHWYELAVLFGILSLFYWNEDVLISVAGKSAIIVCALFLTQIIDNSTARLTRERMVAFTLAVGTALVGLNLLLVSIAHGGGV
ncbi:MAG: complex I subunit 1 family protein [Thermoplasmata archaeon]